MLGSLVSEDLGQPVIVVNKPGAASTIAGAEVAASNPDGYTLLSSPGLVVTLTPFFTKVKYDPLNSFEPLMSAWGFPYAICVRQDAPWKSFKELIEWPEKIRNSEPGSWRGCKGRNVAVRYVARQNAFE